MPKVFRAANIIRYAVVVLGALVITGALLFFMQRAAEGLRRVDPLKYFTIANFIPAPDRGRQLPKAPPKPEEQPARPEVSYDAASGGIPRDEEAGAPPDITLAPVPVPVEPEPSAPQQ
jgi:hypothetical protein